MGIPVCVPVVPANAERYVGEVIRKNWVSSLCLDEGVNFIRKLETGFAALVGTGFATTVTNGTTALELALATLRIGPGDEVILPSFTMIASAASIVHRGATPVFIDSDPETWCLDVSLLEAAITPRTRAIMPVHIYGYPCEMDPIMEIAGRRGLAVVEDAAEAIGTRYRRRHAGSIGDLGCFSFYANKMMTCGEGGMVVTSNPDHAARAAMLKDQAFGPSRFIHEDIGYNFRMNNLTAAYAYASFEEVTGYIARRRKNASLYNEALAGIDGIALPPRDREGIENSYWMYGILIDRLRFGRSKDEVRGLLKSEYGIDSRDFFYPMHKQPVMIRAGYVGTDAKMPVAERLWEEGFYLPSSTGLTEAQIGQIADALRNLKK